MVFIFRLRGEVRREKAASGRFGQPENLKTSYRFETALNVGGRHRHVHLVGADRAGYLGFGQIDFRHRVEVLLRRALSTIM